MTHARAWTAVSTEYKYASFIFFLYSVFYHLDYSVEVDTIASFIVTLNIEQEHNVFSSYTLLLSSFAPVSCICEWVCARARSIQSTRCDAYVIQIVICLFLLYISINVRWKKNVSSIRLEYEYRILDLLILTGESFILSVCLFFRFVSSIAHVTKWHRVYEH